jgi:hypothetical protein
MRVWISSPKALRITAASMAGPSGTARGDALMWMAARTSFMVPPSWGNPNNHAMRGKSTKLMNFPSQRNFVQAQDFNTLIEFLEIIKVIRQQRRFIIRGIDENVRKSYYRLEPLYKSSICHWS